MDPASFIRNIVASWHSRASLGDFIRHLFFTYSIRLPRWARRRDWIIGFHYPPPIGDVRLLLRANGGADAFIHSEVFDHQCYRLALPQPPQTILDLGANIGLSTVFLSRCFPGARLAAVEPEADNFRVLTENLRLNGVDANAICAAVDVEDGKVVMERHTNDYGHRIAATPNPPSDANFEASALSVPSILRRLGWNRVGLLKVDIEGHEKSLLSDHCEWMTLVDTMCLEYHHDGAKPELTRLAGRFGFRGPRQLPGGIWLLTR